MADFERVLVYWDKITKIKKRTGNYCDKILKGRKRRSREIFVVIRESKFYGKL